MTSLIREINDVITESTEPHHKGVVVELEIDTEENTYYRKVIHTSKFSQLVLMSLKPGEDIGLETHKGDQFIRIDKGVAKSILDGKESDMKDGDAVIIPAGVKHNIVNPSDSKDLKIYAVYSPPEHPDGHIDQTKPTVD